MALHKALNQHFGLEDLQNLCFSIDVDFEELAGSSKSGRVRELILYCQRRGMLDQLLMACEAERPNVDWRAIAGLEPAIDSTISRPDIGQSAPNEITTTTKADSTSSPIFQTDSSSRPVTAGRFDGKLKVFLCHASQDKDVVRQLNDQLTSDSYDPWLDALKLLPGMKWDDQIQIALEDCHIVLVCLSRASVSKEGYVQREIGFVLDRAEEMPEGAIFLIPAKLEECELPRRLRDYQAVNLYEAGGYERLREALEYRKRGLSDRA